MADLLSVLEVHSSTDSPGGPSRWRIEPNAVSSGFREGTQCWIRKPSDGCRFLIDDQAVDSDDGHWVWAPGFYAGQVRAELLAADDRVRATYLLDVSPHPDKLVAMRSRPCSIRSGGSIQV